MAGEKQIFGGSGAVGASSFVAQNPMGSCTSFLGSRSILSFDGTSGGKRSNNSVYQSFGQGGENVDDEELEEYYFRQPEKKRRLTAEQVLYLEKNFEDENKLEPERKVELAKELGLQPRQIAVWFQNRRARWKTKHLEKEYDTLQASYDNLKADYDKLLKEKEGLKAEVVHITEKLLMSEKEKDLSSKLSHSSSLTTMALKESSYSVSEDEVSKVSASGLRSDALYSDSPHYADGVNSSSLLELGDSSYAFEHDQSDLSQDEEEVKGKNLFTASYIFPAPEEDSDYCDAANSSFYDFPVDDQALGFWLN